MGIRGAAEDVRGTFEGEESDRDGSFDERDRPSIAEEANEG